MALFLDIKGKSDDLILPQWEHVGVVMAQWNRLRVLITTEAWPFWLAFGGTALSWLVSYFYACHLTDQVLYGGTMLQVCGLATVAYGIHKLRKDFNKPSTVAGIAGWVKEVIKAAVSKPQSGRLEAASVTVASAIGSAGLITASVNKGLDERVAAIEKALNDFREQQTKEVKKIKRDVSRVEGLIHVEEASRQKTDSELLKRIEDISVGGLRLELIGFVWLFAGMLGSSVPKVIADLIPRLFII